MLYYIICFMAFITLYIILLLMNSKKFDHILKDWANKEQYKLLKYERSINLKLPTTNTQRVYSVTIEDANGDISEAWVRCGNFFLGPNTSEVKVKWKKRKPL